MPPASLPQPVDVAGRSLYLYVHRIRPQQPVEGRALYLYTNYTGVLNPVWVASGANNTAAQPAIALPAGRAVDDLLLVVRAGMPVAAGDNLGTLPGFDLLLDATNAPVGQPSQRMQVWGRRCTLTEGATVTPSVSYANIQTSFAVAYRGVKWPATGYPVVSITERKGTGIPSLPAVAGDPYRLAVAVATRGNVSWPGPWGEWIRRANVQEATGTATRTALLDAASRNSGTSPEVTTTTAATPWMTQTLVLQGITPVLELAGAAAGAATAMGTLVVRRGLAATAAGSASAVATLGVSRALSGQSAGLASATGALGKLRGMRGTAVGAANGSGSLTLRRGYRGTAVGQASVTGAMTVQRALAGLATGAATATGRLGALRSLQGTAAGAADAVGRLGIGRLLAGVTAGTSTAIGSLLVRLKPKPPVVGEATTERQAIVTDQPRATVTSDRGVVLADDEEVTWRT